jgi:hypothetical protein
LALLLYALCLESSERPSRSRMALSVGLLVVWANSHAAFLLGPMMLFAAGAGLCCALPVRSGETRGDDRRRGVELLGLGLVGLLATTLNPGFVEPHLAWFIAGDATPNLGLVLDEWLPVSLFGLPSAQLPPSLLSWALYWGLLVAAAISLMATLRAWHAGAARAASAPSPALVALALGTLLAPMVAVRFLWLTFFALLLLAKSLRPVASASRRRAPLLRWTGAGVAIVLLAAYPSLGAWPMISHGVSLTNGSYSRPYPASKYYAHAIWLLQDAGVRGHLFNEYSQGGFLGYWLAPGLRSFANGSLNLTPGAMDAYSRIRAREGRSPEESFGALLVNQDIDVFLGTGLPAIGPAGRPQLSTVGHLEGLADWVLVFRNLTSVIYVRSGPRGASNLEALSAYYARQRVPFDPQRGFDSRRVYEQAPRWAIEHGVAPRGAGMLSKAAMSGDRSQRQAALEALAAFYAGLGSYERAIDLDGRVLQMDPESFASRRRRVWSQLRTRRFEPAREDAKPILDSRDALSRTLANAALEIPELSEEEAAARIALLPVFTRSEASVLRSMIVRPRSREKRD